MKLDYKKIAFALGLVAFLVPLLVLAQNSGFTPLAPIPGTDANADLPTFLNSWFRIGVGVAAFLAVIMIAIGGFEYMGSEGVTNKEAGRSRMMNAVFGLLLILASFIIFALINPKILDFTIGGEKLAPYQPPPSSNQQNQTAPLEPTSGEIKRASRQEGTIYMISNTTSDELRKQCADNYGGVFQQGGERGTDSSRWVCIGPSAPAQQTP